MTGYLLAGWSPPSRFRTRSRTGHVRLDHGLYYERAYPRARARLVSRNGRRSASFSALADEIAGGVAAAPPHVEAAAG